MIGVLALVWFFAFTARSVMVALGWEKSKRKHGVLGAWKREVAHGERRL